MAPASADSAALPSIAVTWGAVSAASTERPGRAHRARAQGVGGRVILEPFRGRIPFEFAAELDGDVAEVTDRGDPVADVDREIGVLAALDAVEEIAVFAVGVGVEVEFVGADDGIEDGGGTGLERTAPAGVADPAVGADELDAGIARFAGHDDAVGVAVGDIVILDGVVEAAFPEGAGAFDFDRAAAFGVVGPLRGVEQVRAPVADDPAGVIPDPAEVEVDAVLGVGGVRGRAEPHLVVEIWRDRLRRGIAGSTGCLRQDDLDRLELADPAVADEFGHAMVDRDRAILGAGLKDPAVAAHGFDQDLAFVDGERRLFALHILAGAEGEHADQGVPVIGGGDHDRVDVGRGRGPRGNPWSSRSPG